MHRRTPGTSSHIAGTTLIGYDGSRDARHAVEAAATALEADAAVVVTVWLPALAPAEAALSLGAGPPLRAEDDVSLEAAARETAREGADRAQTAGLSAEPVVARAESTDDIGRTLSALAAERGAGTIVVGRRGISRLEAVVLGSVSNAVVRHARRPVFVVPARDD